MDEFTSPFWAWYIAVPTVLGILGCYLLVRWMGQRRVSDTETPENTGHVWDEDLRELNNPLPKWWLNMFYITLVFGAVYLLLFPGLAVFPGLLEWSDTKRYEREMQAAEERYGPLFEQYLDVPIRKLAENEAAVQVGKRLYAAYCTTCHGSDAGGVRGFPNLRDSDWLWGGSPEAIETSIAEGRQGVMPAWQGVVGEQGVFQLAEYVRHLSGRYADRSVVDKGEQLYEQHCVACHGPEGKGNKALGAPDLTDNIWLYGGSQRRLIESIGQGRQGRMPAHGEFLGEAKVHLLATYVFSLSVSDEPEGL